MKIQEKKNHHPCLKISSLPVQQIQKPDRDIRQTSLSLIEIVLLEFTVMNGIIQELKAIN